MVRLVCVPVFEGERGERLRDGGGKATEKWRRLFLFLQLPSKRWSLGFVREQWSMNYARADHTTYIWFCSLRTTILDWLAPEMPTENSFHRAAFYRLVDWITGVLTPFNWLIKALIMLLWLKTKSWSNTSKPWKPSLQSTKVWETAI